MFLMKWLSNIFFYIKKYTFIVKTILRILLTKSFDHDFELQQPSLIKKMYSNILLHDWMRSCRYAYENAQMASQNIFYDHLRPEFTSFKDLTDFLFNAMSPSLRRMAHLEDFSQVHDQIISFVLKVCLSQDHFILFISIAKSAF